MESHESLALILGALLAISEALALIPGIKANSIFQLVFNVLKKAAAVFKKKPDA